MSYSYRRTRVNGTSAEFVVTLWKSKTWNLSQFSSCFIYELMLNSGDGGELQDLFVIHVILMLRICFGKTNFRDLKNAEMPCEDPYNRGRLKKIKSVFLYLLLYFILKIIEMNL